MVQFSIQVSTLILLVSKFYGNAAVEQKTDRHLCEFVKEVKREVTDTISFACPRPDKCDGWWNNLFDEDCNDDKVCTKNVSSVVVQNQTVSECCQGWAYDEIGLCSIAVCWPECQNAGKCVIVNDQPTCQCPSEWVGDYCQTPIPNITENCTLTCQNGGTCLKDDNNTVCLCVAGWSGKYCKNDINECETGVHTCSDLCENHSGGYRCKCSKGRMLQEDGSTCGYVEATTVIILPPQSRKEEVNKAVGNWVWAIVVVASLGLLILVLVLILLVRRRRANLILKRGMLTSDMREDECSSDLQVLSNLGGPLYASITKTGRRRQGNDSQTVTIEVRPDSSPSPPPIPLTLMTKLSSSDPSGTDNIYEPMGEVDPVGCDILTLGSYLTPPAQGCRRDNSLYINVQDVLNEVTPRLSKALQDDVLAVPSEYLTPPPSKLRQECGHFNTLPAMNRRTNFPVSLHIYEDPTDLTHSREAGENVILEKSVTPEEDLYDRANLVSSSYSSSTCTSEDNQQTIVLDDNIYDVPRNLNDTRDSDSSDTVIDSEIYDDTSCCSLDMLEDEEQAANSPCPVAQGSPDHHEERDYDFTNENDHVYAEVDAGDTNIYASVADSFVVNTSFDPARDLNLPSDDTRPSSESVTSNVDETDRYCNQHLSRHTGDSIRINSYADMNCDILETNEIEAIYSECGNVADTGETSLTDCERNVDLKDGEDSSAVHADMVSQYSNLDSRSEQPNGTADDNETDIVNNSVYSECQSVAPHYDLIVKGVQNSIDLSTAEEYIGPDFPGEIYENGDRHSQSLYTNQSSINSLNLSDGDLDLGNDYEYIPPSAIEPSFKTQSSVTVENPRTLMRQSTIPENVANWNDNSRDSSIYVLSDDVAKDKDNEYGNTTQIPEEPLYENRDIRPNLDVSGNTSDIESKCSEKQSPTVAMVVFGESVGETAA